MYPYEELSQGPTSYKTVNQNAALLLRAIRPFKDDKGEQREINDEYYFRGPGSYIPRIEEEVLKEIKA